MEAATEAHQLIITNHYSRAISIDDTSRLLTTETNLLSITNNHLRNVRPDNSIEHMTNDESLKFDYCCPFCNYYVVDNKLSNLKYRLCMKHKSPFTCLVHNCNWVFPNLSLFIKHYRRHLALDSRTFLCGKCLDIKKGSRKSKNRHIHQNTSRLFCCCGRNFPTMTSFVMHKLSKHSPNVAMHLKVNVPNNVTDISCENNKIQLFTCTVTNCNKVYDVEAHNIAHYRQHAFIPSNDTICNKCLKSSSENNSSSPCIHDKLIGCVECSVYFNSLHDYAKHKLCLHGAIVICSTEQTLGCPVCLANFDNFCEVKITEHYIKCFSRSYKNNILHCKPKLDPLPETVNLSESSNTIIPVVKKEEMLGSIICPICDYYLKSITEYIDHNSKVHHNITQLKETGIQLCPLCDQNYYSSDYIPHINNCTNTMKISIESNDFGCVHCKQIFKNSSPFLFRRHYNFCKTFSIIFGNVGSSKYYKCSFCTFGSAEMNECVLHANGSCIYFQLKMRYAMKPNEKKIVEERKLLEEFDNKMLESENLNPSCDKSKQKILKSYDYYCNICTNMFFDEIVFLKHLKSDGERCRPKDLWYCNLCLTDFTNENEYKEHITKDLPNVPKALAINIGDKHTIKNEIINELQDEIINGNNEYDNNNLIENNQIYSDPGANDDDNDFKVTNDNKYFLDSGNLNDYEMTIEEEKPDMGFFPSQN